LAFVSASPVQVRGYEEVSPSPPCTTDAVLDIAEETPVVEDYAETTVEVEDFAEETAEVEDFADEVTPLETPSEVLDANENGTPDCEEEVESFVEDLYPTETPTEEPSEVLDFVETPAETLYGGEPGYEGTDAGYLGESEKVEGLGIGGIAGIAAAGVAVVAIAGVAAWKLKGSKKPTSQV
jgi:hypothetical protein